MKFLRNLFRKPDGANDAPHGDADQLERSYRDTIGAMDNDHGGEQAASEVLTNVNAKVNAPSRQSLDIWDMDDGNNNALAGAPDAARLLENAAPASRSPGRARRTKTRLIGFEKSDGDVVDLFDGAPKAAPVVAQRAKFPVGWITVTDGPGRGESFSLLAGMSQIGRGEDQAVQLDFGDNSISRTNHAAVVYDSESNTFLLGHGGKSNIVRINDTPLISNESLKSGDVIRIGETTLQFIALCGGDFSWKDNGGTEEDEDVAIA